MAAPVIDHPLVSNIVKALRWLKMFLDGRTFAEITVSEGTSTRRIQDVVDLALLAPDVLEAITHGKQPVALTSDRLIKCGLPIVWGDQRQMILDLSNGVRT